MTADHIDRAFAVDGRLKAGAEGHVVVVADEEQRVLVLEARVLKDGVAAEIEALALAEVKRAVVILLTVVGGDDNFVCMLGLGEVGIKFVVVDDNDGTVHVADEVICCRKVADGAVGRGAVAVAEGGNIDADHVGAALFGHAVNRGVFCNLGIACSRNLGAVLIGGAVKDADEVRCAQALAHHQIDGAVGDLRCDGVLHFFGHCLDLAAEVEHIGVSHDIVDDNAVHLAAVDGDFRIAVEASGQVAAGVERGDRAVIDRNLGAAGVGTVDRCAVQVLDRAAVHRDVGGAAESVGAVAA